MSSLSSFALREFRKTLYCIINPNFNVQTAGLKYYEPPKPIDDSEWPEIRKLKMMEKQPTFLRRAPKLKKMLRLLRGPEEVHTDLLYKGYGVKAVLGGRLKFEHFEFMRNRINRRLDVERMFAIWRVEAPWQPAFKRGPGKRMGGGKGHIHHYVTPVKAERIIVELGGDVHEIEAKKILCPIAECLPFPARVVSQEMLDKEREEEEWREKNNINPYTMEYVIKNNMGGCQNWLSKYDYEWLGKYK